MKYGYKMFDCNIEEFENYTRSCYNLKLAPEYSKKFKLRRFTDVDEAIKAMGHVYIPYEDRAVGNEVWSLEDGCLLWKQVSFKTDADAVTYQTAIERAWALGGHLDPRVEQSYCD